VDARSIRSCEATLFRADGVVSSANFLLNRKSMNRPRSSLFNTRSKKQNRRSLRKSSTAAEAVLWTCLQNRKLLGKKFRRQSSVGPYIVDFFCPEKRVVVEWDGARHFGPAAGDYDDRRTSYLEERGIKVVRFENRRLYRDLEGVLEEIRKALNERQS
jgi:very-short-patch-repair endonuclease